MAMALGNVYTFGPTFRAEKSYDTRHAAEFWMIEPEMAFADLNTYLETAEAMTRYVIRYLLDNCPDELAFFNQFFDKGLIERLELVASSDFARVTYTDAIELLKKNNDNFQYKVEGYRSADRARALPHRADLQKARVSPTTPRTSRHSICASTRTARPLPPPICWCPALVS